MASGNFDLVLLDILLPGLNGLELLGQLRHKSPVPVIVVSALGDEQARIQGLIGGADDYLPKPFSMAELAVRVEAVLRRVSMERHRAVLPDSVGGLVLQEAEQTACYRQQDLGLTTTEFRLLQVLLEHRDQVLSKPFLYQTVLYRGCGRHDRSLDLHVSHLRRKLRDAGVPESTVRTVWGQGYTLITEHL
jgi:two-component system, OmpR family, response regulator PfeR